MRIEHITERQLLQEYLATAYQGRDVLVVHMDEFIDTVGGENSETCGTFMETLMGLLGGELPTAFQLAGYLIIEMSESSARMLMNPCHGAPFRLEIYKNGEFFDWNR